MNNWLGISALGKKYCYLDQTAMISIFLQCYSVATHGHLASHHKMGLGGYKTVAPKWDIQEVTMQAQGIVPETHD
jgi:hypothetical protein